MAYQQNPNNLGVSASYGPTDTGNTIGTQKRVDNYHRFGIYINGDTFQEGMVSLDNVYVPGGFLLTRATLSTCEDGSGWDGNVQVVFYVDDTEVIIEATPAQLNTPAPTAIELTPVKTTFFALPTRIAINYAGTVAGEGKFELNFEGIGNVTTGYGPTEQPPYFPDQGA